MHLETLARVKASTKSCKIENGITIILDHEFDDWKGSVIIDLKKGDGDEVELLVSNPKDTLPDGSIILDVSCLSKHFGNPMTFIQVPGSKQLRPYDG